MSKVIIAKQPGALDLIFGELNLKEVLADKKNILVKVNLRAAAVKNYTPGATTNLAVIKELVDKLVVLGKDVILAEGTSSRKITARALEYSGIKKLASPRVRILNLNITPTRRIRLPQTKLKYIDVYEPVLRADYIISLPVMKTHAMTQVSLSKKNMMGVTGELTLPRLHLKDLDRSIIELNRVVRPDLSIIDGTRAMEGSGPVHGTEVRLDTLIAGFDPGVVDSVGAQMMGFDPEEIKHLGQTESPEIIGKLIVRKFERPMLGRIDFYSSRWFNWLMAKKIFHKIIYEYGYFAIKKLFGLIG